jgi:hypothetical protein
MWQRVPLCCRESNRAEQCDLRIGLGAEDFVHTITAGAAEPDAPNLVCIAGYSAGAGFFHKVLGGLGSAFQRCFALDLLGTGLSGKEQLARGSSGVCTHPLGALSLRAWAHPTGQSQGLLLAIALAILCDCSHESGCNQPPPPPPPPPTHPPPPPL